MPQQSGADNHRGKPPLLLCPPPSTVRLHLERVNRGFPGQEEELELTFNHDGRSYELGTAYGHIAIGVDDLDGTLERLAEQGIEPEREPYRVREGGSRLCFVQDPDHYRIELIERAA